VYRSQYGLPPCTTANGCFTKVNEQGQASPLPGPDAFTVALYGYLARTPAAWRIDTIRGDPAEEVAGGVVWGETPEAGTRPVNFELEADRALTAEALLLHHLIDRVDRGVETRAVTYLRRRQNEDGGWSLFEGGAPDLSAPIQLYFAMQMAGGQPDGAARLRPRRRIRAKSCFSSAVASATCRYQPAPSAVSHRRHRSL